MRVALEKGVDVVSVNDPFIDLEYMVGTIHRLSYIGGSIARIIREGGGKFTVR